MISAWISGANIRVQIENAIQKFHSDGPVSPLILEQLTYYKHFHPDVFLEYERKLMYVMGLFYKTTEPQSILEEVYSLYAGAIQDEVGKVFTPVQASALKSIKKKRYFSFSAPTSSGKSYLFRELLQQINGDIVIVVPSRALIAEYYHEVISLVENDTLVLQFIDNINTAKTTRRIFIITPERGGELFKRLADFRIKLFLFDEAQISEEEIRGLKFDAFVRRIDRNIPEAKKVFAHPFVENPQAQLSKHGFANDSQAKLYSQQSVGKLFLSHRDGAFAFFSPNTESPNISAQNDLIENIIKGGGTLLVYVSKRLIYSNELRERFSRYIALCSNVENAEAIALIEELRSFIGASVDISDKYSLMIGMMEQGVVIHHGSMPLKARLLVETFIKKGFARVCFSTSTLGQGVNMPFDVVWVNNFHNMKPLTLKNLIGRAGRTSSTANSFDYGYTVVEERNVNTFISRYKEHYHINETSRLDEAIGQVERDYLDIVEAIHNDAFADDYNMPQVQIDRLDNSEVQQKIKYILDTLFVDRRILLGNEYYELSESKRRDIKAAFRAIYIAHLRDRELTNSEKSILSAAIPILLWQVQGKSFSEIVSLRHSLISKKNKRCYINELRAKGEISEVEANSRLKALVARYSPKAAPIPNKRLTRAGVFENGTPVLDVSYDIIVYDTYDYLDKVLSISMADPFCAALKIYHNKTEDIRALTLSHYIRFGTDDEREMWLLRYGFSFEDIEWMLEVVDNVDQSQIYFNDKVNDLSEEHLTVISRFL